MNNNLLGFNGERGELVSGKTYLGNGYRAYNPVLMRFDAPDSWSAFGGAGINSYAYCAGDPVNQADPSGHFSIGGIVGIAAGILGVLFTPFTGGTSLGAAMSVISALAGVASVGLSIASEVVTDPGTATILGWSGMALGILSGIGAGTLSKLAPESVSVGGKLFSSVAGAVRALAPAVTEPAIVTGSAEANLESVMRTAYPIERRIMNYLDTASVHNLRQTSKVFGAAADRAMAFRMRTPETGIPEPVILQADIYRQYSRLPSDELERLLAADEFATTPVDNPEFLTWARKNMLGLGRSRPVSFNAPVHLNSWLFAVWAPSKYKMPYFFLPSYRGEFQVQWHQEVSAQGLTTDLICHNWNKLDHGFWVGF